MSKAGETSAQAIRDQPPACGFIENADRSIEWGDAWERASAYYGEPVCVIYYLEKCGAWIPFSAWTRAKPDDQWFGEHDCDWIEAEDTLYHHESGNGVGVCVHEFVDPSTVPARIWIADGVEVRGPSTREGDDWMPGHALSDDALLAMGYRRVVGPTPDPFADGVEGYTFFDDRQQTRVPDEDGVQCGVCMELFVVVASDIVVVNEYEAVDDHIAGLYRPAWRTRYPDTWVCPLPFAADADADHICPKCAAVAISDYSLHGLLIAWQADREAMSDERSESLLDAVRERVEQWIAGYTEMRVTRVHEWFASTLSGRLGISVDDAHALCEDAGYKRNATGREP